MDTDIWIGPSKKVYAVDEIDRLCQEAFGRDNSICNCCGSMKDLIAGTCPEYGEYYCSPCYKNLLDNEGQCICEGENYESR